MFCVAARYSRLTMEITEEPTDRASLPIPEVDLKNERRQAMPKTTKDNQTSSASKPLGRPMSRRKFLATTAGAATAVEPVSVWDSEAPR